jgi:hypothetical protein
MHREETVGGPSAPVGGPSAPVGGPSAPVGPTDIVLYSSAGNVALERFTIWGGDVTACTVELQDTGVAQLVQLLDCRVENHRIGVHFSAAAIDCSVPRSSDWLRCGGKAVGV